MRVPDHITLIKLKHINSRKYFAVLPILTLRPVLPKQYLKTQKPPSVKNGAIYSGRSAAANAVMHRKRKSFSSAPFADKFFTAALPFNKIRSINMVLYYAKAVLASKKDYVT